MYAIKLGRVNECLLNLISKLKDQHNRQVIKPWTLKIKISYIKLYGLQGALLILENG